MDAASVLFLCPANNKQEIQTAPGVVADNAHKGIAIETLTARSAFFQFYVKISIVMKKYKTDHEREMAMVKAQMKIKDFLEHHASYTELMEYAAKAQAQVFNIIRHCDVDEKDQWDVDDISDFFYFAILAFSLFEPFEEERLHV